jgi:hypothetical protein
MYYSIVHAQYENHEQFPGHTEKFNAFSEIFHGSTGKISLNNFLLCEEFPSAFPYYHENVQTLWTVRREPKGPF